MDPHLARAAAALESSTASLTREELAVHPAGKWSIAEILEHLGRAFSATAAGLDRALDAGKPLARPLDLASRVRTWVVVGCGYLPTGRTSPKVALPRGIDPGEALHFATASLREMDDALERAARRFGPDVKLIDHPVVGPLSARQWRRFHWVHTRHHVRQIQARTSASRPSNNKEPQP